jgi:hypothetical protein
MKGKNTMPNFLVIGTKKSGTTWIYNILKSHRCIYVPKYRKEIHFFDWNYSNGMAWYSSFFPKKRFKKCTKAVGEVTPNYIFDHSAKKRIHRHMPNGKFIIILRNPVDRIMSAYRYYRQRGGKNAFKTFSKRCDRPFKMGLYSNQLKAWFKYFHRNQFLILIFEECVSNPDETKKKIAGFLGVDANEFARNEKKKKNATFIVQKKGFYLMFVRLAALLRKLRLDYLIYLFKQTGFMNLFKSEKIVSQKISSDERSVLKADYSQSIKELEELLGQDLSVWR